MPEPAIDWQQIIDGAVSINIGKSPGPVYLVADSHLGDPAAPMEDFVAMLETLESPGVLVLMGDLFRIWLALPGYWDAATKRVLEALAGLRARGLRVVLVVGNREFFLPERPKVLARRGLPFDQVILDAGWLRWEGQRFLLTHGDIINREDERYLRWRKISRSGWFEGLFRVIPGPLAIRLSRYLEQKLAASDNAYKIHLPVSELEAFATLVRSMGESDSAIQGVFVGHFHHESQYGASGEFAGLRIVPDWLGTRTVLQLGPGGQVSKG